MRRPTLATDLYTDAAIADPYPLYRTIRDLGPAVWLSAHEAWAIGRFDDVRAALRADDVLVSGRGIAMNDLVNGQAARSPRVTLVSDGEVHRQLRTVLMKPMMHTHGRSNGSPEASVRSSQPRADSWWSDLRSAAYSKTLVSTSFIAR